MIYYNVQTNSTETTSVVSISNKVNTFLQFLHAMEYLVLTISFSSLRLIWRVNLPCKNYCSSLLLFNSTGQLQQLQIAYTVYNFSAFMFPYVCGTLMNYYHKKCHRIVQNTLQKLLKTRKSIWQNADLIPMNPDYQFIPSFFGVISIPMNSTGHALTIFLTLLSFLLSLLIQLSVWHLFNVCDHETMKH